MVETMTAPAPDRLSMINEFMGLVAILRDLDENQVARARRYVDCYLPPAERDFARRFLQLKAVLPGREP